MSEKTVTVREAKTHLSRLLADVENGDEVTITRAGRPVARLVALAPVPPQKRELGRERGQIWISPNFDDPMPDAWRDEWER